MSIIRRMRDITAASFNDMLDKAEDPVHLIDSYLRARREQIEQAEILYKQCARHAQSMKQQYATAESMKDKREQQALTALKAGEEEVARYALRDKMLQEEKSEQYKVLYEQSKTSLTELEEQLQQLKDEYQEAYDKRAYYMARLEAVRLQRRLANQADSRGFGRETRVFDRLEEHVSDMELTAQSLRHVRNMTREAVYDIGRSVSHALEAEMQSLKMKLEKEGWSRP